MKRLMFACAVLFVTLCVAVTALAEAGAADAALRQQVNTFVDAWHDDAAHARMAYFDKIAPDGVYIGTDQTELWHKDAFKTWAQPYFAKKAAWTFKASRRNVYVSSDGNTIWFDELLDTQMGPCQASGVVRRTAQGLLIEHYQLSMAVPNAVAPAVTQMIMTHELDKGSAR